jgi:beta-glucosidase
VGSITRPVEELKGFQKIDLAPGETKTVSFRLTPADLRFYNADLRYDWEPGNFDVMIGGNSRDVQTARLNWVK